MGLSRLLLLAAVLFASGASGSAGHEVDDGFCTKEDEQCGGNAEPPPLAPVSEAAKDPRWDKYLQLISAARESYEPCPVSDNCSSCHYDVVRADLLPFRDGISKEMLTAAASKGTKYQIIGHKIFRQKECMFPSRCSGVEHYLKKVAKKLPDIELVVNVRDWPQSHKRFERLPVLSFSKTSDYWDISYPAWAFWEGGPAIKLYPRGLGRWGELRRRLQDAAERWPWDAKHRRAFFRGSRTSAERDALVLLSRERPDLVDAAYTKNQAWKSPKDTLGASPAEEVSLEEHCKFRYLFNMRGVAASFRFKHLFLCGSLVVHVGSEWTEFFYPAMKPWVHYIPLDADASQDQIRQLIEFAMENDDAVWEIAEQGRFFIEKQLRPKDVTCFWTHLLKNYAKLLSFKPQLDPDLIPIP